MKEHKYIDKIIKLYNNQNYKDAKKKLEELLLSNKDDTYLLNNRRLPK